MWTEHIVYRVQSERMSEAPRIADQLKRSVRGTAWHGPSVLEIIEDITPGEALRRPIPRAHSMAELELHITAWLSAVTRGLDSRSTHLTSEEDWPAVPEPFDWTAAREQLRDASKQLSERLETIADVDLDQLVRV